MAQQHSTDALAASTRLANSKWVFRSYKADLLPALSFRGTLPNFNRSITSIDQDDGSQAFVSRSLASSFGNVTLDQNIGLTGGSIFFSTGLQRLDVFGTNSSTSYLSSPVSIGINQDIFSFNPYKWQKQIEPLKLEEAERKLIEDKQDIAIECINRFFNFYDAIINLELARINYANSDTLYKISKGRYQVGKIAEHELLQMELNLLEARKNLQQSKIDSRIAKAKLSNYLGLDNADEIELIPPLITDTFSVFPERAVEIAVAQRSDMLEMQRLKLQAERELDRAKKNAGPNISLSASYGLSGSDIVLTDAYGNTLPQEQFRAGVNIPITNWGKGKAQIKIAESNRALTDLQLRVQRLNLEQEVYNHATQFNFRQQEYYIAAKSDTIGQKRYEIAYKRFLIGKIDITDLNLALRDKDSSRRSFVSAMRNYWIDYYRLKKLTLFDFENEKYLVPNE